MMEHGKLKSSLETFVRETSLVRLGQHCPAYAMRIEDIRSGFPLTQPSDYMCLILLWGFHASIQLKLHFSMEVARELAGTTLQMAPDELTDQMTLAFMREASNMQGGNMRSHFDDLGFYMGMSLPFIADGAEDQIFQKIRNMRASTMSWQMTDGTRSLFCTSEIEIKNAQRLAKIEPGLMAVLEKVKNSKSADEGEVEFL